MFCMYCTATFPLVSDTDSIGKLSLFAKKQKNTPMFSVKLILSHKRVQRLKAQNANVPAGGQTGFALATLWDPPLCTNCCVSG